MFQAKEVVVVVIFGLSCSSPVLVWIAYFVAFGPHGPRAPTSLPGDGLKILLAVVGLLGASAVLHWVIRSFGTPFILLFIVLLTLLYG